MDKEFTSAQGADNRLVTGGADDVERAAEAALRPKRLEDFVGQQVVRGQLSVVLRAALARGATPTTSCSRARPVWGRRPWP